MLLLALGLAAGTLSSCRSDDGGPTTRPAMRGGETPVAIAALNTACFCGQLVRDGGSTAGFMGQVIGFCSSSCAAKWNAMNDAQRTDFIERELATLGPVNALCVCGSPVSRHAPVASFDGHMIGFCSASCASRWNTLNRVEKSQQLNAIASHPGN
jgi:hypothetical protein